MNYFGKILSGGKSKPKGGAMKKKAKSKPKKPKSKKPARKPAGKKKKATAKKKTGVKKAVSTPKTKMPVVIGTVTHFFPHVQAAVVKLKKELVAGTEVAFKGHTTNFTQKVDSIQMDHVAVPKGKKGEEIGLGVKERVREGDEVLAV